MPALGELLTKSQVERMGLSSRDTVDTLDCLRWLTLIQRQQRGVQRDDQLKFIGFF